MLKTLINKYQLNNKELAEVVDIALYDISGNRKHVDFKEFINILEQSILVLRRCN